MTRMGCTMLPTPDDLLPSERESAQKRAEDIRASDEKAKRAKHHEFEDELREMLAMALSRLRYSKMVDGRTVDEFKALMANLLSITKAALIADSKLIVTDANESQAMQTTIMAKLNWFDGLQTEALELRYLKSVVPVQEPIVRQLGPPQTSIDAEGDTPLRPRRSRKRVSYDFKIPPLLQRLMNHNATVPLLLAPPRPCFALQSRPLRSFRRCGTTSTRRS